MINQKGIQMENTLKLTEKQLSLIKETQAIIEDKLKMIGLSQIDSLALHEKLRAIEEGQRLCAQEISVLKKRIDEIMESFIRTSEFDGYNMTGYNMETGELTFDVSSRKPEEEK